jgi:hypothetical protein
MSSCARRELELNSIQLEHTKPVIPGERRSRSFGRIAIDHNSADE